MGWYGTVAIIGAYALLSFGMLTSSDFWYQFLNFSGAVGIIVISFYKRAYQPGVLNSIWALIALFAIIKIVFH